MPDMPDEYTKVEFPFTMRIERVIPDYLARKRALAENGGRYV